MWRAWVLVAIGLVGLWVPSLPAGRLPNHHWEVLAVAYPPDRTVSVLLGGAERTLAAKGLCQVKWRDNVATLEIEIENLPAPAEVGKPGQQYVLWAIDSEKKIVNLGLVPWQGKQAKWKVQVPFRIFGLLVTVEGDSKAEVPSTTVALESLLLTDPFLIVPVFRVDVALAPPEQG
ncbi:MAG: hypothetical protein HY647_00245 [Acidobacteria bacterium]|nr:hypothetical protein [Acidobacteriota bacterium]